MSPCIRSAVPVVPQTEGRSPCPSVSPFSYRYSLVLLSRGRRVREWADRSAWALHSQLERRSEVSKKQRKQQDPVEQLMEYIFQQGLIAMFKNAEGRERGIPEDDVLAIGNASWFA